MSDNVTRFTSSLQIPKGNERARLKILAGADSGAIYTVSGSKVTIGRAEDNDISIDDTQASRHHAEIIFGLEGGGALIADLGSANGIIINGNPTIKAQLKSGDKILIGDTLIEIQFMLRESTKKLQKGIAVGPAYSNVPQMAKDAAIGAAKEAKEKVNNATKAALGNNSKQAKTRLVILGIVILAVYFLFLADPVGKKIKKNLGFDDVTIPRTGFVQIEEKIEKESKKAADKFFKEGFREFREKNYYRARANFESALQMYPNHELSKIYLANVFKSIDADVEQNMREGTIAMQNLKYRKAMNHFDAVMTLLAIDPTNAKYKEAKEAKEAARKKLEEDDIQ